MIRKLLVAIILLFPSSLCFAQQFDPFNGQADSYHADMRLFFPDAAQELSSRRLLEDSVHLFDQGEWSVQNLRSHLDQYEALTTSLQRHYQYFRLLGEKNRKDTAIRKALQETSGQLDILQSKADSILQTPVFAHLTPSTIQANNLSPYSYFLAQESVKAAHALNPSAEKLSDALAGQLLDKLTDRYDDLIDTIKAGSVIINGKTYNVQTDKAAMLQNADPVVRRAAIRLAFGTYNRHAELFAATLIDITREKNALAVSHNYYNAPAEYYGERVQLSEDSVRQLFEKVAANAQVLKDYQSLQQQLVRQTINTDTVHSWDIGLISAYHWQPLAFADVRKLVNNALAPLGEDYQQHFAKLLDPANGLLDIAYTDNRAGGGNSYGHTGTPIGLFMQRFDGGLRNTSTLIHEGGHAVHRQLMSENHVMPSYFSGPNFMFEAYAMFNELLLLDELEKQATTKDAKAYYTRQFADKLAREIFTSAEEGAFEQGLYDGVAARKINGLKDINTLYSGIMSRYDRYFPTEPERQSEWINKSLVFEDPLYNANYLFAMLVTCKLYQQHLNDPKHFAQNYNALLSHGFDRPVKELLKKYMGIDLNYSDLLNDALTLMRNKTTQLSKLASDK